MTIDPASQEVSWFLCEVSSFTDWMNDRDWMFSLSDGFSIADWGDDRKAMFVSYQYLTCVPLLWLSNNPVGIQRGVWYHRGVCQSPHNQAHNTGDVRWVHHLHDPYRYRAGSFIGEAWAKIDVTSVMSRGNARIPEVKTATFTGSHGASSSNGRTN